MMRSHFVRDILRKSVWFRPLPLSALSAFARHGSVSCMLSPSRFRLSCQRDQSQAAVEVLGRRRCEFSATLYSKCSSAPPSSISVRQTSAEGMFLIGCAMVIRGLRHRKGQQQHDSACAHLATVRPSHPHPAPSSTIFNPGRLLCECVRAHVRACVRVHVA